MFINQNDMKNIRSPWYFYRNGVLIKKRKPFFIGDYVHINKWDGCYKVEDVTVEGFKIKKDHKIVFLPWEEFRCLKGEGKSDITMIKRELRRLGSSLTGNVFQVNNILKMLSK